MSELIRHLRDSGAVDPQQLDAALRRQQIYGGSLDTVLLELELLTAQRMDELLALACGLPPVPAHLFAPRDRGWDRVPGALVELGWVMPLGVVDGRVHVAVHPELADDKLAQLRRELPGVVPMVTAECCVAKLASERTSSVIPQRYAVLAMRYIDELSRHAAAQSVRAAAVPAPWMTTPTVEPPGTVPPTPSTEITQTLPRFSPPPRSPDAPVPRETERTRAVFHPPPLRNPAVPAPLPEPPPYHSSAPRPKTESNLRALLDAEEQTLATGAMAGAPTVSSELAEPEPARRSMAGSARQASEPIAEALQEQFAAAQAEISMARDRDNVTDAVLRAAMLISPRVALFGVKREGLRGLAGPGAIPGVTGTLVAITTRLDAALTDGPVRERVTDLDLRMAVEQESAVPCVLAPVKVRGRAVLLLYIDRDGRDFSEEDLLRARDLCEAASESLEQVLRLLAASRPPVTRGGAAATVPPPGPPPGPGEPRAPTATTTGSGWSGRPRTRTRTRTLSSGDSGRPSIEMPQLVSETVQARLPNLVEPTPPVRFHTLVGQGPSSELPPDDLRRAAAAAAAQLERAPTLPGLESRVTESNARTLPGLEDGRASEGTIPGVVDPHAQAVSFWQTPRSVAPREPVVLEPEPRRGITPLASPLAQATTRGQLLFEDEAPTEVKEPPASDSIEARVDASLQSAMGGGGSVSGLLQFGERALSRIAGRFPGPIDVFRRDLDSLPPPAAHGPLIRVAIQIGEPIVPHLVELMDHRSPNVRFYSAFVFQALRDDRAIRTLCELAFDADSDVRSISMRVLETYSRSLDYPSAVARVRSELGSDNRTRQLHATRALGTLRDRHAVPQLIDLLASGDRYVQEAALESLCSITGQQLGLKPQRWRKWYAENGGHHRVEWIMSSLQHRDIAVRRWAADELRRITGQDIDFPATADQAQRDAALRRWMEWWHNHGHGLFEP